MATTTPSSPEQAAAWALVESLVSPPKTWRGPLWYPLVLQPVWQRGSLRVLAGVERKSDGRDYLHVSASQVGGRATPTWAELARIRRDFFAPDAFVFQAFPPESEWFSLVEALHLWQRLGADRLVPDLRVFEPMIGEMGV